MPLISELRKNQRRSMQRRFVTDTLIMVRHYAMSSGRARCTPGLKNATQNRQG